MYLDNNLNLLNSLLKLDGFVSFFKSIPRILLIFLFDWFQNFSQIFDFYTELVSLRFLH